MNVRERLKSYLANKKSQADINHRNWLIDVNGSDYVPYADRLAKIKHEKQRQEFEKRKQENEKRQKESFIQWQINEKERLARIEKEKAEWIQTQESQGWHYDSNYSKGYIYIYTDELNQQANRFKIGYSINDPRVRVKQQDSTSNSSPLVVIGFWKANHLRDFDVHNALMKKGFQRIRKNREWFEISGDVKHIIKSIIFDLGGGQ